MLHLFETLCAVAETGSLSKAAEVLHVTQPAVTRQIKALEQDLGAVLLTRTPQGVELTPAGQQVLLHARQALTAVAACRRAAADSAPGEHGRLSVATGNMLMQFVLPPVLAEFRVTRPEVALELYTGHYQDCLDRVSAYTADLAIISTPQIPPVLKARPLFLDPVVLVAAPRTAHATGVLLSDLQGATLFVLPKAAGLRQEVTRVLGAAGVVCTLVQHSTVEIIKTMVGLGLGAALLPHSAVAADVAAGRLTAAVVRDWPVGGRTVLAVTRGEGALPEPVSAFLKALRDRYVHET